MKAVVLELRDGAAAVLREDGVFATTTQPCQVGDTIELAAEILPFPQRRTRWLRSAVAAVLALVILGGSYTYTAAMACSYVSLDLNGSSMEFSINRLGRVISVQGLNEGGEELAGSLDVRNKKVDDALDAAMEQLEGYIQEDGVLIAGVTSTSAERGEELSRTVERSVARSGREDIRLYTLEASEYERSQAREQRMSSGRYVYENRAINPAEGTERMPGNGPGASLYVIEAAKAEEEARERAKAEAEAAEAAARKAKAEAARDKGITNVVFDRGGYIYHGRVAALAEGAREGGLEF